MRAMQPDDLYAINWVSDCAISPDGKRVAVVVTRMDRELDGYRSAIWAIDTRGGEARQLTAGRHRDSAPRWSPDGRSLAFLSRRSEDPPQLYVLPADMGEARQLTDRVLGAGAPVWSPDGTRIVFSGRTGDEPDSDTKKAKPYRRITSLKYRLNGEGFTYDHRRHLFVVAVDGDNAATQITDGDWDDASPAWSPDGASIAFVSARHRTRELNAVFDLFVVAAEGGRARRVTDSSGRCSTPSWSPDGGTLAHLFAPDEGRPGNSTLHLVDAAGGKSRAVDPSFDRQSGGAEAPAWLPDHALVVLAQDRGVSAPAVLLQGSTARWVAKTARTVSSLSVAVDGRTAAMVASTVTAPAELFRVDLQTGRTRQLTSVNESWLSDVTLQPAEQVTVPTAEGVDVDCWIMKPAGFRRGERYPVLLNIHGGPFGQYGESFFDEFQVYAAAGYGVVFCNPRGSSGQSTQFARAVIGNMGGPDYHDIMVAFDAALDRMPWADRSRLGVLGGSYGGFMTSWAIGHTDRFAAACSERAVNDWYTMQGTSDIGAGANRSFLGDRALIQDDLLAVLNQSPLTFAKHVQTPLLILHSENDLRCPISQAEQLFVALRQMGKEVEFVRFPDETHELSRSGRPSHRVDRFNVILEFFDRKLKAEVAPA